MNTLEFLPGTEVKNVGTIKGLHFTDLFDMSYVVDDNVLSENDIKSQIIGSKEKLFERQFNLIQRNEKLFFKYLNKLMMSTKSIPLINVLNQKIIEIKSEIRHLDFDWENYTDHNSIKTKLKDFLVIYYTNKYINN